MQIQYLIFQYINTNYTYKICVFLIELLTRKPDFPKNNERLLFQELLRDLLCITLFNNPLAIGTLLCCSRCIRWLYEGKYTRKYFHKLLVIYNTIYKYTITKCRDKQKAIQQAVKLKMEKVISNVIIGAIKIHTTFKNAQHPIIPTSITCHFSPDPCGQKST